VPASPGSSAREATMMLVGSAALIVVGALWIRKLIKIEV
jgi:Flp pilus assembly protein TadB